MTAPSPFKEDLHNAKENLKKLQNIMKESGILRIFLEYNGSGDSGYIEGGYIEGVNQNDADQDDVVDPEASLWANVENAAFSVLTYNYPGWESNEGSRGNITFELNENGKISAKISHELAEYIEEPEIEGIPEGMNKGDAFSP